MAGLTVNVSCFPASTCQLVQLLPGERDAISEELWGIRHSGEGSIHQQPWPSYDEKLLQVDQCAIVVQVNGKVRDTIQAALNLPQPEVEELARSSERVQRFLNGSQIRKVFYVPNKLINLVVG